MDRLAQGCQGVVARDGKTLRRSYDRAVRPGGRRVTPASGQCLGCGTKAGAGPNGRCWQVQRDNREITALPKLLELLSLPGRVVTADAMHCPRQVAQQVVGQSADYVLALKGNQRTLHDDVRLFLEDPSHAGGRSHSGQQGSWPGRNPHRQCQR
jgi:hypothetical protein